MKCAEFEIMGLAAQRDGSLTELERVAARQHADNCPHCAALQDSWQAARGELQLLTDDTQSAEAPARLEMRLRQEFRMQHRTVKTERAAAIAMWVLATAAVLVSAIVWHNWKVMRQEAAVKQQIAPVAVAENSAAPQFNMNTGAVGMNAEVLLADSDDSGFTLLPGVFANDAEDTAIMQVRLQRGTLRELGLPVNPEAAADWVDVDLLVGDDGQPRAVRVPAAAQ